MKVRLDIDTNTFVRFWLVVVGFGMAGFMIYSAREALLIVGAALFLAVALNEPVSRLARLLPGKSRLAGTALAFSFVVFILGIVFWFVLPPLIQQSAKFVETIPPLVEDVGNRWQGLNEFIARYNLQGQVDSALDSMKSQTAGWATNAGSSILDGVGSLASFLVALFLTIVLSFLMLLEGPAWMKRIWGLYRDEARRDNHRRVLSRVYSVITGYITGQLTVSAIGAMAAGLCVFILSLVFPAIPSNLFMPTILLTFVLTLIPMFGSTLAGGLIGLLLVFNDPTAAIIYVIYFVIYQQIENNFVSPVVQAKTVELSALIVLAAVTIGVYVGGIVGGIVAIPIAGSIKVLIEEYISRNGADDDRKSRRKLKQR